MGLGTGLVVSLGLRPWDTVALGVTELPPSSAVT